MTRMFAAIALAAISGAAVAGEVGEARLNLQKWGLAYCLAQHMSSPAARDDSARAQGAYFQRGGHDDEAAYAEIRAFFDERAKQVTGTVSSGGERLVLVGCLDIYESEAYRAEVKGLDVYVDLGP